MASAGLLQSFLAAIQASLSVLLVIFYGCIAAHSRLIDRANTKPISKICVRIFLPALLITKVGSELHGESAGRYLVILAWAVVCHVVSFSAGILGHLGLGMPDWTTVAILINNTTSYPLLLVTALEDTGILGPLIVADESTKDAIERAKSYFLVFSTVSNCITFAVGPRLIDSEHAPEPEEEEEDKAVNGHAQENNHTPTPDVEAANEQTRLLSSQLPNSFPSPAPSRRNSFFGTRPRDPQQLAPKPDRRRSWFVPRQRWYHLSPRTKWWLLFVTDFFNAPLLGAIVGAIIGLVPVLHRVFFNSSDDGGIFTAWLTASLKTVGGLFVSLPVVVAGVTLCCATKEAVRNHESIVSMPWGTVLYILLVRFIAWPALSIGCVYVLATRTGMLGSDPILWFCLMMMPAGPSAMKLITLVQVAEGSKDDEVHILRLLTVS
ncbi:7728729c-8546-4f9e-aa20-3b80acbae824 [Thermothielavioides terrestris]|uniref:7728729c-8546-4f9e-aa20-3b80acbae824 n=1 Tax=Thermothielavioides terrestris TaxID=2587410 RepID=A0A3S4BMB4_9PEZI|nr:7728729c-8546-4f9e-aa20-3b80acbae824 [Thermothielavioides terrestris]